MLENIFKNGLKRLNKNEVKYQAVPKMIPVEQMLQRDFTADEIIAQSKIQTFMENGIVEVQSRKSLGWISAKTQIQNSMVRALVEGVEKDDKDDIKFAESHNGAIYYYLGNKPMAVLFEAEIRITNKILVHNNPDTSVEYYEIQVQNQYMCKNINIRVSDYAAKAFDIIVKKCPNIRFFSPISNAKKLMSDYMNKIASEANPAKLQTKDIFEFSGWFKPKAKRWIYLHGGMPNVKDNRCLAENIKMEDFYLFSLSKDLLNMPYQDKSTIIFLHAHLGYLAKLLNEANFPPHYLLFLKGKTNTGKTSLLSELSGEIMYEKPQLARLEDTRSYLEGAISEMQDSLLLIDDAHPAPTLQMEKEMKQNLELITRAYGDFQTRGKRNLRKQLTKTSICGAAWITGEFLDVAAQSSALRIIEVELENNAVNRDVLSLLQEHKYIAKNYFSGYVYFLQEHFDEFVDFFRANLYRRRNFWANELATNIARTVDIAVTMDFISWTIFRYGEDNNQNLTSWQGEVYQYIKNILRIKIQKDSRVDPIEMYKCVFKSLYDAGSLKIAPSKDIFRQNINFFGYDEGQYFIVINAYVEKAIISECRNRGIAFLPPTLKQLFSAKILLEDKPKRFSQYRADNSRPTMIAIKKFFY